VVGDPIGITRRDAGKRQNLRLRQWRRTHLMRCLLDKAEVAGIRVVRVDERGTSSTCPECGLRVAKPKGRAFSCPHCGHAGHRDLIAARNIAGRSGGSTSSPLLVTHRRALRLHGVTDAAISWTRIGLARHRAASDSGGVARR
jgi:transposase